MNSIFRKDAPIWWYVAGLAIGCFMGYCAGVRDGESSGGRKDRDYNRVFQFQYRVGKTLSDLRRENNDSLRSLEHQLNTGLYEENNRPDLLPKKSLVNAYTYEMGKQRILAEAYEKLDLDTSTIYIDSLTIGSPNGTIDIKPSIKNVLHTRQPHPRSTQTVFLRQRQMSRPSRNRMDTELLSAKPADPFQSDPGKRVVSDTEPDDDDDIISYQAERGSRHRPTETHRFRWVQH